MGKHETPPPIQNDSAGTPEFSTIADIRQAKLRRVRNIQDGLTPGEFLLLTEMFKSASSLPNTKDRILVASGYRTMSERTGQDPKTVKRNRQGLVRKLCIDIVGQNTFTDAAQCRVYHFDSILGRWRGAGMIWVRRSGRSVEFALVPPGGVSHMHPVGVNQSYPVGASDWPSGVYPHSPTGEIPQPPTGETPPAGGGIAHTGGGGVSHASLSRSSISKIYASPSALILKAVSDVFGFVDDDAVLRMTAACREKAPDASEEEIAYFAQGTAARIARMNGISNRIGLLITQVPRCFEGEAFRQFRQAERQRREAEQRQQEQQRMEWRRMLDDPATSDEDRMWLRQALEQP